jgi:hypothetical protein
MKRSGQRNASEAGNASVMALLVVVTMLGVSGAVLAVGMRGQGERTGLVADEQAVHAARAGIAHAVANLTAGDATDVGAVDAPLAFGNGEYWADVEDLGDELFRVTAVGRAQRREHAVEAMITGPSGGIYQNAIFAGNSSGDATYDLELGGIGGQADLVDGDIYSGQDASVTDDATVTGTIRAIGSVTGVAGETGKKQPIPDLAAMDYPNTADFDVAALFAAGQSYKSDDAGGKAYQMPESSPAHIFRKNPSDRSTETSSTVKNDYFLEDPYETVNSDSKQDGSNPFGISLSGISGEPGTSSNQKVFYIDGNLWLHNKKSYSLGLKHNEPDGVQVTFVVSGNIYFSDNLFYEDAEKDGLAFIAMKDSDVEDSGNVYFGDPVFGTLQQMNAFMYAENNFYDNNLDASGSAKVTLNGNMTAGNQVLIDRDYGASHTKLTVNFDDRIATEELDMPGLPGSSGSEPEAYQVVAWRRVAVPEVAGP